MSYLSEVLADAPLGYWRLGEAVGVTPAEDATANNNDSLSEVGVVHGLAGALASSLDTSYGFDGSDDKVLLPGALAAVVNKPTTAEALPTWTLECWVRADPTNGLNTFAFSIGHLAENATIISIAINNGGLGRFVGYYRTTANANAQVGSLSGGGGLEPDVNERDNVWRHMVFLADGTDLRLYRNAVLVGVVGPGNPGSQDFGPQPNTNVTADRLAIGCLPRSTDGQFFKGGVDEPAIYDYALSPARILAHYNAGIAAGGGTPVGTSRSLPYVVRAPVGTSRAINWTVNGPIAVTRSLPYKVLNSVGTSRTLPYKLHLRPPRRLSGVLGRAVLGRAVLGRAAAATSTGGVSTVSISRALPYKIGQFVGISRALPYKLRTTVGASRAINYKVRSVVGTSRTVTYKVLNSATISRQISYSVAGNVGTSRSLPFKIMQFTGISRATPYKVRSLVTTSRALPYKIRQLASTSRALPYVVFIKVGTSRALPYRVLVLAGASRSILWKILSRFGDFPTDLIQPLSLVLDARSANLAIDERMVELDLDESISDMELDEKIEAALELDARTVSLNLDPRTASLTLDARESDMDLDDNQKDVTLDA